MRYSDLVESSRPIEVPAPVLELCGSLARHGFQAWVVGGCVRDSLRGVPVADWDLTTDATPEEMRKVFRRTIPTGIEHGTLTVVHRGEHYEVTTLRGEGTYTDGRRPDHVRFVSAIEEDLARRDFTVNAIAFDPTTQAFVDPWGGRDDLQRRVLRAVRDPRERFAEDGLRVLRAARFVATLEFALDPATEAAIPATLDTLRRVSAERVHDEWAKALVKAERPSLAFDVMRRTGMLAVHAPVVAALDEPTFSRAMRRVDAAPKDLCGRLASLVFDVNEGPDRWLRDLRFSNDERERTAHLWRACRTDGCEAWDDRQVRRFLRVATRARALQVLALDLADRTARGVSLESNTRLAERCLQQLAQGVPLASSDLAIGGEDVMRALGRGPGRHVGLVLAALLERTLDEPSLNERVALLAQVPEVANSLEVS